MGISLVFPAGRRTPRLAGICCKRKGRVVPRNTVDHSRPTGLCAYLLEGEATSVADHVSRLRCRSLLTLDCQFL
jgi:hypothetical protein